MARRPALRLGLGPLEQGATRDAKAKKSKEATWDASASASARGVMDAWIKNDEDEGDVHVPQPQRAALPKNVSIPTPRTSVD
jgi:hypothetical protein